MKQKMELTHRGGRGFTLIELLIVVAIIAILAAIAVPNFLEAQVRAKVARASNDMRTMVTALESYAVDYGAYAPVGGVTAAGEVHVPNAALGGYTNKFATGALTTPVAYISSMPYDIFMDSKAQSEQRLIYYSYLANEKQRFPASFAPNTAPQYRLEQFGDYVLWACGPDGDRIDLGPPQVPALGPLALGFYDPTNGTISNGDLVRSPRLNSSR